MQWCGGPADLAAGHRLASPGDPGQIATANAKQPEASLPVIQLYAAIWQASDRRQIILILLSLAIAGLAAVPLEFQKNIVNLLADGTLAARELYLLGAGMMAAILLSLTLKGIAGYRAGVLGEDLIRLIRTHLVEEAKTQAPGRRVPAGSLATAVSAEAEELGKFAGSAFSEPVVQIGTLISVIGYIAMTQPGLGLIALAMIAPQVVLVLVTQKRINLLVAERVRLLRRATDVITSADLDEAARRVTNEFDAIFEARRTMFIWKLSTKFLLSTINGAGVIAVLMLGGWLVLKGRNGCGHRGRRNRGPRSHSGANQVKFELLRGLLRDPEEPAPDRATRR